MNVKLRAGQYMIPVRLEKKDGRIFFHFRYNRQLIDSIKLFEGRKYHGFDPVPRKVWSVPETEGNLFRLDFLLGKNPYAPFDSPLIDYKSKRNLYEHQKVMVAHCLTRKRAILACEMGTGKTLAAIEVLENVLPSNCDHERYAWYVGPKSGIVAVQRELDKWHSAIRPKMITYQGLVQLLKSWPPGMIAPKIVIVDESAKVKTPNTQRTQAVSYLAKCIREEWRDDGYVILMSGAPAPKSPADWWSQCNIAQPGFIKEGSYQDFMYNLCLVEKMESASGVTFPKIVTWWDSEDKCKVCGKGEDDIHHKDFVYDLIQSGEYDITNSLSLNALRVKCEQVDPTISLQPFNLEKVHRFIPARNEVQRLYRRMQGLVLVYFKKDCLDLPEIQFERRYIKTTPDILRAAKLITETIPRVVTARMYLRELSDGFQYTQEQIGTQECPVCHGAGLYVDPLNEEGDCPSCGGTGKEGVFKRAALRLPCPKDAVIEEYLDSHSEVGRLIIWAAFTETIDHLIKVCQDAGWCVLRVDKRGFCGFDSKNQPLDAQKLLAAMDQSDPNKKGYLDMFPKLVFIGHPKAGGNAITLTAAPTMIYYSNDDDGDARIQSIHRFHRAGMDVNRGCTVVDLIHLKTDEMILTGHKNKKYLQDLTMMDIKKAIMEQDNEQVS